MTRIAIFQARTGIDPAANAEALGRGDRGRRRTGGAAMLFTPEMSGLLDRDRSAPRRTSGIRMKTRSCRGARRRAQARNLGAPGLAGAGKRDGRLVNRGFVIDPRGEIRGRYDKIHLFDVDLPTGESWRESALYQAGDEAVLVKGTPVGSLGLTICYDLRFPALFAGLAEAGADVIAVPAAFTVPTGKAHWEVLLRARAIEAGLFVVAAAQSGRHEDGRQTYGHSLLVDPWGDVLLDMGEATGVGFADIDLAGSTRCAAAFRRSTTASRSARSMAQ